MIVGDSYPERLLLREYGAVFVARGGAIPPDRIVFADSAEVSRFQATLEVSHQTIGDFSMQLQAPAMDRLLQAISQAASEDLSISPRGSDSARRSYEETIDLWASRVEPALRHWVGKGKINQQRADALKSLSPFEQVPEVLQLEQEGIWFAKDVSKSIIYSVAPPGTSQHLSMLAFDVREHEDPRVRDLLAQHGWFQTVISDLPHFTYLGVAEADLVQLGLKSIESADRTFWVPDI